MSIVLYADDKEISVLMPGEGFLLCSTMAAYNHSVVYLMEILTFPNVVRMRNVTRPSPTLRGDLT